MTKIQEDKKPLATSVSEVSNTDRLRFAPDGHIWMCMACGKTHSDRYGLKGKGSPGWDEACMLNAELVKSKE